MYVKRLFRRYRSEIRIILLLVILTLFINLYHSVQKIFVPKAEGTTLSTSDVITPVYVPATNTPIPTLVVPTTVQINIYVNNTTPIYNQFYNSYLSPLPSSNSTSTISNELTIIPTFTIHPTTVPTATSIPTSTPTPTPTSLPLLSSFIGKYYNNTSLSGTPVLTRVDNEINFNWGNESPGNNINQDYYSVEWTGVINSDSGTYQITISHDDGMRIYVDNNLIHNHWINHAPEIEKISISLINGQHDLKIQYFEYNLGASVSFQLSKL